MKTISHDIMLKVISILVLLQITFSGAAFAQQNLLQPQTKTNWTVPTFSGLTPTSSSSGYTGTSTNWSNTSFVTDNSTSNAATVTLVSNKTGTGLGGSCGLGLSQNLTSATAQFSVGSSEVYSAGNYVAFTINANHSDATYSIQTSMDGSAYTEAIHLTNINNTGKREIGAYAIENYKYVRLTVVLAAPDVCNTSSIYALSLFHLVQKNNTPVGLTCNITSPVVAPVFNVTASPNISQIINNDIEDSYSLGALLSYYTLKVTDNTNVYPIGSYLGYKIAVGGLLNGTLDLSLLQGVTIETSLHGTIQETKSGSDLVLGLTLLGGASAPYEVGLLLTKPANEIKITLNGLGILSTLNVYHAVYKCFAEGSAFACNTPTRLNTPSYPVYVDKSTAGLVGIGIGNDGVRGLDNIVDADLTNYASFGTSVNLATSAAISVKKSLSSFQGGTFAGFDIANASGLLNATVLSNFHVETYLAGAIQESSATGASLLNLGTGLLNGNGRQTIGFKTTNEFDEIRFVIKHTISANLLGQLRIYGAVVQSFCAGTALACGTATANLRTPMTRPN